MKKILVLAALMTMGSAAKAEVFSCGFTEPFYTMTYNTATQVLTETNDVEQKSRSLKNVSFTVLAPGRFELRTARGARLMVLELTGKGSDGMSDTIYPYEAKYTNGKSGANNGVGGCSSTKLPVKSERI